MLAECPLMVLRIKPARKDWPEWTVLGLVLVAWTVGCAAVLSHSLFVTNDSLSNYAHVWYVARRLLGRGRHSRSISPRLATATLSPSRTLSSPGFRRRC